MPLSLSTTTIGVPRPPACPIASEGAAAGHRAVADHGDDLAVAVLAAGWRRALQVAHALLDADGGADRRRGVPGAHDVVLGLLARAERREPFVLANRLEPVASAGEDLVRIGL